jgi:carboxypeptidase C (cathepsin A)
VLGGKPISYVATASTIDLKDPKGDVGARIFYVAYTAEGSNGRQRPVTFVFNGGPGSSTLWLHMGSFGPVRVETSDAEPTPPPPYRIVDNSETLLDKTDLVFVDAVGTGFSRIVGKGEPKGYYGVDPDIAAFSQFIERWVNANNRWNSPKYILGESYGTMRGCAVVHALERRGMAFNGIILVSSFLNGFDEWGDRAAILYLPTMAATAWYHRKLQDAPPNLTDFLLEVRAFAVGEYAQALQKGDALDVPTRAAIAKRLHRYISVPEPLLLNANLRYDSSRFAKELLRDERRTVGFLDTRFRGIDRDAAGERPEYDAANTAFNSAFTGAVNSWLRETLGYRTDELYKAVAYEDIHEWDMHHRGMPMPDVTQDLREVMTVNPHLRVFAANGYFDFSTPFFETEYALSHMGLDPKLLKNITYGYYPSGHMMYLHEPSLRQMRADLARFYDDGSSKPEPGRGPER